MLEVNAFQYDYLHKFLLYIIDVILHYNTCTFMSGLFLTMLGIEEHINIFT